MGIYRPIGLLDGPFENRGIGLLEARASIVYHKRLIYIRVRFKSGSRLPWRIFPIEGKSILLKSKLISSQFSRFWLDMTWSLSLAARHSTPYPTNGGFSNGRSTPFCYPGFYPSYKLPCYRRSTARWSWVSNDTFESAIFANYKRLLYLQKKISNTIF